MLHFALTKQTLRCVEISRDRLNTGPDGAVAKSSANGLVGTGFVSRLQPRAGF